MKKHIIILLFLSLVFSACSRNPVTGQSTFSIINNSVLFPISYHQYEEFLSENTVVKEGSYAEMVIRVGNRIRQAAERLLLTEGEENYFDDYRWEFHLIESEEVNAWVMPGGKIAIYTGILPLAIDEDGLAVIMGHEIAHAILNHGQQRMSAELVQELISIGLYLGTSLLEISEETRLLIMTAYGVGSHLGAILPFSRSHENEADYYGLILMTMAGYRPEAAVSFWERMAEHESGGFEWLSTHPSGANRAAQLLQWIPEALEKANSIADNTEKILRR